jgi:hypothetical protein
MKVMGTIFDAEENYSTLYIDSPALSDLSAVDSLSFTLTVRRIT